VTPSRDVAAPERQIVIAGIGEAWQADGPVERELAERALPSGVSLHELGTGALDIAYDVMRGYDALVLIDVDQRHRGDAAVATVAREEEIDARIEDGQTVNHQGMDAPTVLHFVKHVGGWPGQVVIVPCDPDAGADGATRAVDLAMATIEDLRSA